MADEPEYQWWNPSGAFGDPVNKATIDAQNSKEDEDFLESLRQPKPRGFVGNTQWEHFSDYKIKNWDAETKILANYHRESVKQDAPLSSQAMGRGLYRDEYGDHSGELYSPATDAQIANHIRFNSAKQPLYQWDSIQDTSKVEQGLIAEEKYWTSGQDTWDMIYGNGGATIDSQNKEVDKHSKVSTLAPISSTAAPPKPPAYVVKESKYADLFDAIEDIESFPDRTPEQRMKVKNGGGKDPAIGPMQIRKIFVDEVNRQNHTLKKNPNAPMYKHEDARDYNKAREISAQFLDLKMNELEKFLGRKPTNRELALFFHFGVSNIKQKGADDYGKKFDTFYQKRQTKKEARIKEEEAKKKADAEAAAKKTKK